MSRLLLILTYSLLVACASTSEPPHSNYSRELTLPKQTTSFVLVDAHIYDEPLLGASYNYKNPQYTSDAITVYIYPIPEFGLNYKKTAGLLKREAEHVLAEIDYTIEQGHYKSRSEAKEEPFNLIVNEGIYEGLKSSFDFEVNNGITIHSNTYLFRQKDKYIKLRTSFDSRAPIKWNGDNAAQEILPNINVPNESPYMKQWRKQREEEFQNAFMQKLLQAVSEEKPQRENN